MIPGSANPLLLKSAAAAGGYQIERSLRFNSSDSASLSRASYAGSGTFSCWVKRCKLGTAQTIISGVAFNASDQLNSSTAVFRDPSALMHVLVSTSGTYVNSTLVASGSAITPGIIGSGCDLYLADIHFIDGQALTPSSFTEVSATTGQLIPKAYTGTYGTNGFKLTFSDNSATTATTLGKDSAGSNNWTPNNFSVTAGAGNDSLVDTPTSYGTDTGVGGEVRGNYCTWNAVDKGSNVNLANGNLDTSQTAAGIVRGTIGVSSGKWYWEYTCAASTSNAIMIGIATAQAGLGISSVGGDAYSWGYYGVNGQKYTNNSGASYGASFTTNDVIGVALDADNGTLTFYKNGTSQGQAYSGLTSGPYFPAVGTTNQNGSANFGQRPFAYTAPSGFKALCDTNLPTPVVAKSSTAFDVKLFSGNGSTQNITGFAFSPDFAWFKRRSSAFSHELFDVIRGGSNVLFSDLTSAEANNAALVTSFNSDGVSVGSALGANGAGVTSVMWAWDAGTSTVTNTQGSITSQVRANTSAGFSIVTYTGNATAGATVGHGLGVAPALIINKQRSGTNNWWTYHVSMGATQYMVLDLTNAAATANTVWNNTAPTSTVFSIGVTGVTNTNSATYVTYCFAPVAGYSNAFTYSGNGSTDGPFCFLGFRPRLILLKVSNTTGGWYLFDTARNTYNVMNNRLEANSASAEASDRNVVDALSNGFKLRDVDAVWNQNGNTYIGFAWAENPFQYARAR